MRDRARIVTALLAVGVASVVAACGSIIGIEDGVLDPELNGSADDAGFDTAPAKDSSPADTAPAVDAAPAKSPLGNPGGDRDNIACASGSSCSVKDGKTCCVYRENGMFTALCAATCPPLSGAEDRSGTMKCTRPSNCDTGDDCCYVRTTSSFTTQCKSSCNTSNGELKMCDPDSSNSGCPWGSSCRRFMGDTLPQSYGYCL